MNIVKSIPNFPECNAQFLLGPNASQKLAAHYIRIWLWLWSDGEGGGGQIQLTRNWASGWLMAFKKLTLEL